MSGDLKHKKEYESVNLHEVAQQSSIKDDVILRIEEGKRFRQLQREETRRRQLRLVAALALSFLIISGVGYLSYRQFSKTPKGIAEQPTPTPISNTEITLVGRPAIYTGDDRYKLTKATLNVPDEGSLDLYTYDFYSNKFLKGQVVLTDQPALEDVLKSFRDEKELRDRLEKSWVLIFAGASCEGTDDCNLELSGCRVKAVTRMMVQRIGVACQGYWGIQAGEYKKNPPGDLRCEDKPSRAISDADDKWLEDQRRLIVAIITPNYAVRKEDEDRAINRLVVAFYDHDLLPGGYQYGSTDTRTTRIDVNRLAEQTPANKCCRETK
jgi:hypothetical protein